jgi:hypothetical protein
MKGFYSLFNQVEGIGAIEDFGEVNEGPIILY